jgi:hypothetical protein
MANTRVPGYLDSSRFSGDTAAEAIEVTGDPTGFADPEADITITWSDAAKTLTVAPTGSTFDVWVQGERFIKSTEVKDISAVIAEGYWYFYYDTDGVLQGSQTAWEFEDNAPVALVYWDSTNTKALSVWWEPHRLTMDWATHQYLHETVGTRFESGLAVSGSIVGTGALAVDAQVAVAAGIIHDEDLVISITQGVGGARFEQDLALPAKLPIWYLSGAAPVWRVKTANSFPLMESSPAGTRIRYNQFVSPNWVLTPIATNNDFMAVWVFATNDQTHPVIGILGQREDTSFGDAQVNNTLSNLNLAGLAFPEMKILARLIFQTSNTYGNTPKARLREILDLRRVQDLPGGGFVATNHNSLSGRSDPNSHPASAISVVTTNFNGGLSATDADAQAALDTIDDKLYNDYAERIVQFSYTGTTNFQQVLRLTTGVVPAGDYVVHWYITLSSNDENKFVQYRCQVDDTTNVINPTLGYLGRSLPKANNGADIAQSGFRKVTLTNATHTIDLDVALTDAGKVVYVEQASIFLRRV